MKQIRGSRRQRKLPTIGDVAARACVSARTISRAVNCKRGVRGICSQTRHSGEINEPHITPEHSFVQRQSDGPPTK